MPSYLTILAVLSGVVLISAIAVAQCMRSPVDVGRQTCLHIARDEAAALRDALPNTIDRDAIARTMVADAERRC